MHRGEVAGIDCMIPETATQFPSIFCLMENNIPELQFNGFMSNLSSPQTFPAVLEFTPQPVSLSKNSTSDEADEQRLKIIDERRQRRMISNRESARRSRMRKQRHLDELWSHVIRLRTENHNLIDKLNHVSESHQQVLQENARLKEEASGLHQMLTSLQVTSPYNSLREIEELPCNTAHLRAESSNHSFPSSTDLLL